MTDTRDVSTGIKKKKNKKVKLEKAYSNSFN